MQLFFSRAVGHRLRRKGVSVTLNSNSDPMWLVRYCEICSELYLGPTEVYHVAGPPF